MSTDSPEISVDADRDEVAANADLQATVERLERAIEDERQHSASLRSTVNELRFQAEILEKSYSKQLADARQTAEAAQSNVGEHLDRITELESERDAAIQMLADAKAKYDRLDAARNQVHQQLSSSGPSPIAAKNKSVELEAEEGTINTLMNDAKWVGEKAPSDEEGSKAETEARAAEEAAEEEMISPDLVFTTKAADT